MEPAGMEGAHQLGQNLKREQRLRLKALEQEVHV
jgi:hypothetical protein